jgi:hypothetical protein
MKKDANNNHPNTAGLRALYGHLILHLLPAWLHHTVVKAFQGTKNLNPLRPDQKFELGAPASLKF